MDKLHHFSALSGAITNTFSRASVLTLALLGLQFSINTQADEVSKALSSTTEEKIIDIEITGTEDETEDTIMQRAYAETNGQDGIITVVNLNSAIGLEHDRKNIIYHPYYWYPLFEVVLNWGASGVDFNDADLKLLIDDLFGGNRNPDIITMQEVALKAAVGTDANTPDIGELKGIKARLDDRTGDEWKLYVNVDGEYQYYRAERGRADGDGIKSSAGTAIFVREGAGSDVETSSAIFFTKDSDIDRSVENGVVFENTPKHDPGSLVGAHVKTKGKEIGIDIYTCHTWNVHDDPERHNREVASIRNTIVDKSIGPVIWTGDFNAEVEHSMSLQAAIVNDGFIDNSPWWGTASKVFWRYRHDFDHILTRGIYSIGEDGRDYPVVVPFEARASDHKGLYIAFDPDKYLID
jgi:hypothetical protein